MKGSDTKPRGPEGIRAEEREVIQAENVSWGEGGRTILSGITLGLLRGECLGVIGPNGAGKTSLVRILSGLVRPSSGTVLLEGRPIRSYSRREIACVVARVAQRATVPAGYRVGEVVLHGRTPHLRGFGLATDHDREISARMLEAVGIAHLAERRIETLSGGEVRLVILARAMAQETPVLLLDEPMTFLDLGHQVLAHRLVRRMHGEGRRTVLLVAHDVNAVAGLCDRLVALKDGRIVAEGPADKVIHPDVLEPLYGVPLRRVGDGRPFIAPRDVLGGMER